MVKLTKNKASTDDDISQQHSSNDFMNYFTSEINTIRDQIVTMQPSATASHQIVQCRSTKELFYSFSTIGDEELYKLVKSAKPTTCMLDPIPSKLLKYVLPEVIYIYAFSRRFYPKLLTVHSGYTFFVSICVPWELNPQPFALLTQCSTTEPKER